MTNYKEIISDAMKRAAVSSPEKMRERKIGALTEIRERLAYYERRCYADELLCAIARKKAGFLLQAATVGTIREILKPSVPHYDGFEFHTGRYHVAEEELIGWGEASLRAPLTGAGARRFAEIFAEIYPEQGKKIFNPGGKND